MNAPAARTARAPHRLATTAGARRAFLAAVPLAVAFVIVGHPPDPATARALGARTDLYIWVHVGLLLLLPLLGMVVWMLLEGLTGAAATLARVLLPVALVFYAAFDALVGIGSGLLSREALQMSGADLAGAEALAIRWMQIPAPMSIISGLAVVVWTAALLAAAVAHRRAGSSWMAVGGLALAGPLFGFGHPHIAGLLGMAGLLAAAMAIESHRGRAR